MASEGETATYMPVPTANGASPTGGLQLSEDQLDALTFACREHDTGRVSEDLTVAGCWDADRLNLWRVGIRPDPVLLSTAAARRAERIEWARALQEQPFTWPGVLERFEAPLAHRLGEGA